jgi:hypothetical protein
MTYPVLKARILRPGGSEKPLPYRPQRKKTDVAHSYKFLAPLRIRKMKTDDAARGSSPEYVAALELPPMTAS